MSKELIEKLKDPEVREQLIGIIQEAISRLNITLESSELPESLSDDLSERKIFLL